MLVPMGDALKITGTFLDEISHDIPHQNWGEREWDQDFRYMRSIGIDTVIMIRSGYRKFITYPSAHLLGKGCYMPSVDLLDMFLRLAGKYHMKFYFGLYDSGKYWDTGDLSWEVEDNKYVIDEVWSRYGEKYKSFGGWYISGEISRKTKGAIGAFHAMGKQCKDVSGGLPTFISPWIDGKKAVMGTDKLTKEDAVSVQEHEREWNEIFDGIHDVVDACAFQDGHIDYDELDAFFTVNKKLADKYGMKCWTNAETFDRDMPIDFFNIRFTVRGLICLMNFLMWFGNTTILLMAGIMGIDQSLFEAANIDGASSLQVFFKVTLPLLTPILVYTIITALIGGLQMFDVPQVLTNALGTPNRTSTTLVMYLNNYLKTSKNYGMSGAISVVIFLITGLLSLVVFKSLTKQEEN